jgi:predicted nucleic acid-binding protein
LAEALVLETAALLDLVAGNEEGRAVRAALASQRVHVVDRVGANVAAALQDLAGRGLISVDQLNHRIRLLASTPFTSHSSVDLLPSALRRVELRLDDALSVELSDRLVAPLLTTDSRLASIWPNCWLVVPARPTGTAR